MIFQAKIVVGSLIEPSFNAIAPQLFHPKKAIAPQLFHPKKAIAPQLFHSKKAIALLPIHTPGDAEGKGEALRTSLHPSKSGLRESVRDRILGAALPLWQAISCIQQRLLNVSSA